MMKKLVKIISMSIIAMMIFAAAVSGAETEQFVRVRVRSPRQYNEQANLSGYSSISVYDLKNGTEEEIFKLDSELSVLIDSYYDRNYNYLQDSAGADYGPYHVKLKNREFSSYDEAIEDIKNYQDMAGIPFYPYYNGESYEICIGSFAGESDAKQLSAALTGHKLANEIINGNKENIIVYDSGNNPVFMYNNSYDIFFTSDNSGLDMKMIKIDSKPYRGMMGFYILEDSRMISINYVDLEGYLYGVVPNEMSASWPEEALKTQAVAARTYAGRALGSYMYNGYMLEDNQNSQVYKGYSSEDERSSRAVDETKGEMIYYDGELIEAFYHSTSGGRTENSENIWMTPLPYLVGVEDEYSNSSPYTYWNRTATKDYIIECLNEDGQNVSELYDVQLTKISENNRVVECVFYTDKGELTYKKEFIRKLLGYNFLLSSWFTIDNGNFFYYADKSSFIPEPDGVLGDILDDEKTKAEYQSGSINGNYLISKNGKTKLTADNFAFISADGVTIKHTGTEEYYINGRGYGHGVGMSQYGAKEMAAEGFTYDEILKYYYTGVNIK
jgi:stage II sporulation protein D